METPRELRTWLLQSVIKALDELAQAPKEGLFSTGFASDVTAEMNRALMRGDEDVKNLYNYAGSYFLSKGHRDPDHCGLSWPEADARLELYMSRIEG